MNSRLAQVQQADPVLTNLARGYSNAQMVGHALFPFAPVTKEIVKIPKFSKESFKAINTERAIRAKSNVLDPDDIDDAEIVLKEHDISFPLDNRELANSKGTLNLERYGTFTASQVIALSVERACAALATTPANYASTNKVSLAGNDRFTDYTNSDPIKVIKAGKEAVRQQVGRRPNVALVGAATMAVLSEHPKILERVKYSQLGVVTADLLAAILGLQKVVVGEAVAMNARGVVSDVWGDNIVLAYVPVMPQDVPNNVYEPSFGYTLRHEDYPKAAPWTSEDGKVQNINVTDLCAPCILGADAGYLIADTNA